MQCGQYELTPQSFMPTLAATFVQTRESPIVITDNIIGVGFFPGYAKWPEKH